jgi:arginyl-tRNA synthetase
MKQEIIQIIQSACLELYDADVVVELDRPDEQHGDFATNVAMRLAKPLHRNPRDLAQEIVEKLKDNLMFSSVGVAGPGFINITLANSYLITSLKERPSKSMSGLKIVVEYSDPNPFKPLHAGHLYTTIVGDVIARLIEVAGAEIVRINYGGDVGLHVARSMWAIIKNLGGEYPEKLNNITQENIASWMGERYVEGNNAYLDDVQAKLEIVTVNKRIYELHQQNDHESPFSQIYWKLRDASYNFFTSLYDQLEVHPFDRFIPESEVTKLGVDTVQEQLKKGTFEQSDGAIVFNGEKFGLFTNVFINSEGLPTYSAKDVGLSLTKWKDYNFDESIIITANEQSQYMAVVIKAIEQFAPEPAQRTKHLTHGIVKLQGGAKMSSRKGNILLAQEIIDAAKEAGKLSGNANKESVVLAAIKYALLKNRIGGDIIYDPNESISMEGNSGPYLQYAHARAKSILRKSEIKNPGIEADSTLDVHEKSLARKISEYPEIIEKAVLELSPHVICSYLYDLAQTFNRFYENSKVIGDDKEELRIGLVDKYTNILNDGLTLLGIEAPDSM